jgi:hypothetical protein
MLCYKDRTFCDAPCAAKSCRRKFTDADRAGAKRWWAGISFGEPPVAFSDMSAGCADYRPLITEDE